jgi:tetratricopeptide (TPR) repeat protein
MFHRLIWLACALLLGAAPAAALAQWKEATSKNFIVYSEGSEAELREFATKLEKFDYVLRAYHKVTAPPSPLKLRVYLLPTIAAVGKMAGGAGVGGYYISDARGLMMVGTRTGTGGRGSDIRSAREVVDFDYESILLHEYAHHFMYQYFPATYPSWYSEGFAEFWGATRFLPGNIVEVGLPANYRFGSFWSNRWLPLNKLLTAQSYADVPELDLLYAEGWLLMRYAWEKPERQRQLQAYLTAINGGASYEDAVKQGFGDPSSLNSELFAYAGRSKFSVLRLPFKPIDPGTITIRSVSPAENALMSYAIRLGQGILQRDAADFVKRLRQDASRFPDDPHALGLLAEAERLAGNREAANAAVDGLLKAAPNDPQGLMRKGQLEIDALKAAGSKDQKAWRAARQYLMRANKLAPKDPLVLEAYYDSFRAQGVLPPEAAQNALYDAMELAPSDDELRYKLAADFEQRNMIEEAIAIIRPAAFVLPHRKNETESEKKKREEREEKYRSAGREKRETAREMFDRLKTKLAATKGPAKAGG